jgi:hypothetical protein
LTGLSRKASSGKRSDQRFYSHAYTAGNDRKKHPAYYSLHQSLDGRMIMAQRPGIIIYRAVLPPVNTIVFRMKCRIWDFFRYLVNPETGSPQRNGIS